MSIIDAIIFAEQRHRGEFREPAANKVPYITHPLAVAKHLQDCGYRDGVLIEAAILHDVVENAMTQRVKEMGWTQVWESVGEPLLGQIRRQFGPEVADVVQELTDPPKPRPIRREHQRTHLYRERAAIVKIADKTCNVRNLMAARPWPAEQMREYIEHASEVVRKSCQLSEREPVLQRAWEEAVAAFGTGAP